MSTAVKVGQVWRDKDKRRNTVIEILGVDVILNTAIGLVVGTEKEQTYKVSRLVNRWELVEEKPVDKELSAMLSGAPVEHNATKRVVGGRNYHLLVECPVDGEDGQRFRTTQKQFDSFGAPLCGCHHKAMNLIEQH